MLLHLTYLLVALFGTHTGKAAGHGLAEVVDQFHRHNIPEDLHIDFNPLVQLQVTFPQVNGSSISVDAGRQLEKNATLLSPSYSIDGHAGPGPFVIICVDPDAPTPQNRTLSEVRHFMGGNFSLTDARDPHHLVNTTEATTYYHEPRPIRSSAIHRYIFLLYKQSSAYTAAAQTLTNPNYAIVRFNLSSFMNTAGLDQPIGGTFMLVGPDASSPLTSTPPTPTPP
ncbi:PEBP-like protein [Agrocybe pediades]|nr:PEBP-like protein [Agrocybe pediades]